MTINDAIGQVVKNHLEQNKISRKTFIEISGISRTNLYNIIEGNISPTADTLLLLSRAMNISATELIERASQIMKS